MEEAASEEKSAYALTPRMETIREALKPIADAICAYPGVFEAALWWRLGACEGIVRSANAGAPADRARDAAIAALARRIEFVDRPLDGNSAFVLGSHEIHALCKGMPSAIGPEISVFARAASSATAQVRVMVLAGKAADAPATLTVVELGWRAAVCALGAAEKEQSRAFWRSRAIDAGEECSRARADSQAEAKRHSAELAAVQTELADQRAMAANLALRMFTAIDEERARIARDLHDDQAQLIAAAQVALEHGGGQARAIFTRASDELRRAVRGLKAAALGRQNLERALRAEFKLLAEAGIAAKLTLGPGAKRLSRSAQQLCWHAAREALANVIRHSRASRVEVAISRRRGCAVISITDNGHGMPAGRPRNSSGLDGLGERLRLMGGSLTIESAPGATRAVAEIPELA